MRFFLTLVVLLTSILAANAEDLVIVGTGSSTSILKELGDVFMAENPDITVVLPPSIGSTGGIKAVGNNESVVGRIARDLSLKEHRHGLQVLPVARVPVVFFVNSSVSLKDITPEQVCRIYDGTTRRWDELGAGKGKIRVIRREDGDAATAILERDLAGFAQDSLTGRAKTTYSDAKTITEAKEQRNSIAFGSWSDLMNEDGIAVLKLNGRLPTENEYMCTGTLSLIYKEKNASGALREFIDFLSTPSARETIIANGGLPAE